MSILITNIKELLQVENIPKKMVCGKEMSILPTIKNAFLWIENDLIKDFGKMENLPIIFVEKTIDASGKIVLPTWCDSHTHIVYAGNREQEFMTAKRSSGKTRGAKITTGFRAVNFRVL